MRTRQIDRGKTRGKQRDGKKERSELEVESDRKAKTEVEPEG